MSKRIATTFLILGMASAIGFFLSCERDKPAEAPGPIPFKGRCQVYEGSPSGSLSVVVKPCRTLLLPKTLSGQAATFTGPDGQTYQKPLASATNKKELLVFSGHRAAKLGGIYLKLEEARFLFRDLGLPESALAPVPVIFPFTLPAESLPASRRIGYSPSFNSLVLAEMEDAFTPEPALAPGLAARAYFEALADRIVTDKLRARPEDDKGRQVLRNTRKAILFAWATYFGAVAAGSEHYLDAMAKSGEWNMSSPHLLGDEHYEDLVNTPTGFYDPTPAAAAFAACLWAGRKAAGEEYRIFYDKELVRIFTGSDNPLSGPNPDLPVVLEHLASTLAPAPRRQVCPCLWTTFSKVMDRVPACAYLKKLPE